VKYTIYYEESFLSLLISIYLSNNNRNIVRLATFLKRVYVRVTYIIKKNREGHEIPRIKTITGLVILRDNYKL
jgi:hypothetical protein